MTRRKVKMAFIENALDRKNTYKKRKQSVLRKTEEISTLCGVEACAIVYSSNDPEAQIWPSDDAAVKSVIERFKGLSKWEQSKFMVDKDEFITQTIVKKREQVRKIEKGNKEDELTVFMFQCMSAGAVQPQDDMKSDDLNNLSSIIERNISAITRRLRNLDINEMIPNQQPQIQQQSIQTMVQIPDYQSQMQSQRYQNPMLTPSFLPQIQSQSSYLTRMETPNYLPQIQSNSYQSVMNPSSSSTQAHFNTQPKSYQSVMNASSSSTQAHFNTQLNQNSIEVPAFQPHIQNQSYQSQMEIPVYQPQVQTQPNHTPMQNPLYQASQMQAQPYQPLVEASSSSQPQLPKTSYQTTLDPPPYQPQMQTPVLAAANTEEMPTQLNDGNATNLNADSTASQWVMDMLNDDDFDPIMSGYFDSPL